MNQFFPGFDFASLTQKGFKILFILIIAQIAKRVVKLVVRKMRLASQKVSQRTTPEQQQQGLRGRAPQNAPDAMVFPNVPPNTPFNTVGMKFPITIEKRDETGHLVESHQNVPPGLVNIGTGPKKGTVIETPAQKRYGGYRNLPKY